MFFAFCLNLYCPNCQSPVPLSLQTSMSVQQACYGTTALRGASTTREDMSVPVSMAFNSKEMASIAKVLP